MDASSLVVMDMDMDMGMGMAHIEIGCILAGGRDAKVAPLAK